MGCCASYEREPRPISIGSPEDVQKVGGASPPQALITLQEAARRQMQELQYAYENSQAGGAQTTRQQKTKSISSNVGKSSEITQSPPTSGGGSSKRYSHHGSGGDPRRHSQHGSREHRRSMRVEQR